MKLRDLVDGLDFSGVPTVRVQDISDVLFHGAQVAAARKERDETVQLAIAKCAHEEWSSALCYGVDDGLRLSVGAVQRSRDAQIRHEAASADEQFRTKEKALNEWLDSRAYEVPQSLWDEYFSDVLRRREQGEASRKYGGA